MRPMHLPAMPAPTASSMAAWWGSIASANLPSCAGGAWMAPPACCRPRTVHGAARRAGPAGPTARSCASASARMPASPSMGRQARRSPSTSPKRVSPARANSCVAGWCCRTAIAPCRSRSSCTGRRTTPASTCTRRNICFLRRAWACSSTTNAAPGSPPARTRRTSICCPTMPSLRCTKPVAWRGRARRASASWVAARRVGSRRWRPARPTTPPSWWWAMAWRTARSPRTATR